MPTPSTHCNDKLLHTPELRCPVCAGALGGEEQVHCRRCHTPAHPACWEYNGLCAVYACGGSGLGIRERGATLELIQSLPSAISVFIVAGAVFSWGLAMNSLAPEGSFPVWVTYLRQVRFQAHSTLLGAPQTKKKQGQPVRRTLPHTGGEKALDEVATMCVTILAAIKPTLVPDLEKPDS